VRELENILERATALCEGSQIQSEDLQLPEHHHTSDQEDVSQLNDYLGDKEKEAILEALEKTRHNKTAAAKLLGISYRSIRYKLKKLGID
jgi:two-component system response regulator PilR (NtrC family)